jgi:DNA mismatch endonuclease, patch repair protein
MDTVSAAVRSRIMAAVPQRRTKPEVLIRRELRRRRIKFRGNVGGLPGKPDILLLEKGIVLFVHGCFWHRHPRCRLATTPSSNIPFWSAKFLANKRRDSRNMRILRERGFRPVVIWQCQAQRAADKAVERILLKYSQGRRGLREG